MAPPAAAADDTCLQASGFFVLRTPLLAVDELREWSDGLCAADGLARSADLEAALEADRALLTERLRTAWQRPEIQEAVFIASPELHAALRRAELTPNSTEAARALRSFVAYFSRMTARSTPFGLFAGCSVGTLSDRTEFELAPKTHYQRHTRLDMDYLSGLVSGLEADPLVRATLCYAPNSSLYPAGGRLHYAESRLGQAGRSHHLVALESTPELVSTLATADGGAALNELSTALIGGDISEVEAREFIGELVDNQVLVSDLGPDITGAEAIHGLIRRLKGHSETRPVAERLEYVHRELVCCDAAGVGGNTDTRYAAIHASLAPLPATAELARLFQVDMLKPATRLSLGPAVVEEIARGVTTLHRLARRANGQTAIERFTQRFVERYEAAEVPLVDALDEEMGIGFGTSAEPGGEPLLDGIDLPTRQPEPATWLPQHDVLLRLLTAAVEQGSHTLALRPADLDALAAPEPVTPLPVAIEVLARVAAPSAEAIDRGDFRVWIQAASGPSGARLLGRFCHADAVLEQHVQQHLRVEEAHQPDAIFAEIVHLPEGRLGNVLSRPLLRDYEVVFLGQSGAARERRIPVADLRVAIRGGRIVLRSARLDRQVIPRLTTAHNFSRRGLGMYRFLCALQQQGSLPGLGWSWGPLENAAFLPRVISGRVVLARACWNLDVSELRRLTAGCAASQFASVQQWRSDRRLPRYVALADGDNELLIDLDNALSVETFLHLVKGRTAARLTELFPCADELCVRGPEGRFLHELIIPFVTKRPVDVARPIGHSQSAARPSVPRRFGPGSEWLFAKLYAGRAVTDRLLVETVQPAVAKALESGLADEWFFIRYADPEPHVRLRFHGHPLRLASELVPALSAAFAPLVEDGRLARWQLDTYVREVERYGGDQGICIAEQLFQVDSECVLTILGITSGDDGLGWRWRLAVCGVDLLLDGLGLNLKDKCGWARRQRDAFFAEFRADGRLKQQLGGKYRTERSALMDLLRLVRSPQAAHTPALAALIKRTARLAPLAEGLHAANRAGRLGVPIDDLAASYAHMHINRLLRSDHRFQELVIYELLDRMYRSQLALGGG